MQLQHNVLELDNGKREGNGNPLQYSCLENPMGKGAWQATLHGFAKSWIPLKQLSMHTWPVARRQLYTACVPAWCPVQASLVPEGLSCLSM